VKAVNTSVPGQVVKQTESKFENQVEDKVAFDNLSNASPALAPTKSSVNKNQVELSQPTAVTTNTQSIAPISSSQAFSGTVLNDFVVLETESKIETNQLPGVTSSGNIETTKASQANQVQASNFTSQQSVAQSSEDATVQTEISQPASKGFDVVSSTFVNSLVGGPQRSITTVMDWVALKPQESPRPVVPHELRLDAGAVQVEIQRMVKQGGGHVVMELTPPDQSKFTIELKLDEVGGAYLRVEGVSDSTKTRLEQSAPQLQEQFLEMGLNLQLDMRQNKDSSSSGAANWMPNEPGFDNNQLPEASAQTTRAVAAERARNNNGSQVYLYA
jgi:hypothetical protein